MKKSDDELKKKADQLADQMLQEMRGVRKNDHLSNPFSAPKKTAAKKSPVKKAAHNPRSRALPDGMSPVTAYVRSLGDYKTTQEVADELGFSAQWVRKMVGIPGIDAPSYVAPFGRMKVHLYTKEDIQELRNYIKRQNTVIKRSEFNG